MIFCMHDTICRELFNKGVIMKLKLATILLLSSATAAQANECGNVTISDMNWSSASLIANIDQFILENGFGCEVDLVPGETVPTIASMVEKKQPDIAPELWTNGVKEVLEKGISEGRIIKAGDSLIDGGEEGFWVPAYLVDKYPELKTIEGVKKHAELFEHPEDDTISGFYNCPSGWSCQITGKNLFKALGLAEAGFEIVDPGSSAGLSGSIANAYERKKGWFGYYWAPTAILGKYDMVKVDLGADLDMEEYLNCTSKEDCEDPKVTKHPPSPVNTIVTAKFSKTNPQIMQYLSKRGFKNTDMNKLLAWMEDEQANSEDAMIYFMKNYSDLWKTWVSESVAEKISAEL